MVAVAVAHGSETNRIHRSPTKHDGEAPPCDLAKFSFVLLAEPNAEGALVHPEVVPAAVRFEIKQDIVNVTQPDRVQRFTKNHARSRTGQSKTPRERMLRSR